MIQLEFVQKRTLLEERQYHITYPVKDIFK